MENALLLLLAIAFLFFVFKRFPAAPDPERIVIYIPQERSAGGGGTLLFLLLALIATLIVLGQ